jgi:hypothetical protein
VKSTVRFLRGISSTFCTWGGAQFLSGIVFGIQATSFTYYLTYSGELGDIEMLGQGDLEDCPP